MERAANNERIKTDETSARGSQIKKKKGCREPGLGPSRPGGDLRKKNTIKKRRKKSRRKARPLKRRTGGKNRASYLPTPGNAESFQVVTQTLKFLHQQGKAEAKEKTRDQREKENSAKSVNKEHKESLEEKKGEEGGRRSPDGFPKGWPK